MACTSAPIPRKREIAKPKSPIARFRRKVFGTSRGVMGESQRELWQYATPRWNPESAVIPYERDTATLYVGRFWKATSSPRRLTAILCNRVLLKLAHRGHMPTPMKRTTPPIQRSAAPGAPLAPSAPSPPSTKRRVRLKEICAECGLSASTVWRIRTRIAGFPLPDAYGRRDLDDCVAFIAGMSKEDRRVARYGKPRTSARHSASAPGGLSGAFTGKRSQRGKTAP